MSCVLANRIVLNLRKLDRSSRIIVEDEVQDNTGTSFNTPDTLSAYEMRTLRVMRAETQISGVYESTEEDVM